MDSVRTLILRHRTLAALVLALMLCMKAMLPVGYMVGTSGTQLSIEICNGQGGRILTEILVPMKGDSAPSDHQQKGGGDCLFSSLSMGTMTGADPVLLASAIAFIVALAFAPSTILALRRVRYLSPPLRGPPALS